MQESFSSSTVDFSICRAPSRQIAGRHHKGTTRPLLRAKRPMATSDHEILQFRWRTTRIGRFRGVLIHYRRPNPLLAEVTPPFTLQFLPPVTPSVIA